MLSARQEVLDQLQYEADKGRVYVYTQTGNIICAIVELIEQLQAAPSLLTPTDRARLEAALATPATLARGWSRREDAIQSVITDIVGGRDAESLARWLLERDVALRGAE